jgi:hypothetical protein
MKKLGVALFGALCLLGAPSRTRAQNSPDTVVQSPDQAVAQDAAEYAQRFVVPLAEASARLRALDASIVASDAIRATYAGRLAGIAVEHQPQLQITVLLTGDEAVPGTVFYAAGIDVPIVYRTGARATREAVVGAITAHQAAIRASLLRPPGIGLDDRTGEMVVLVSESDRQREGLEALQGRLAGLAGVPVRVEVSSGAVANMAMIGGARLVGRPDPAGPRYICTTGFAVTDGTTIGLATAAHCADALSYSEGGHSVALDYIGQWGWGYRDVQINSSREPVAPLIFADTRKTATRPIRRARARSSTRVGDFVCHRGERTGYSCAEVVMTDFAPAGDLCGGSCLPTWVAVAGPTCGGGDSGSPVFAGTTALGVLKGGTYRPDGSCVMYYYMSVDYLPAPWRLLID